MIHQKNNILSKNNKILISFLISFIVFMVYCIIKNNSTFYYDSSYYWSLSNSFYLDGEFSLTKFFPESIRGYFFPFILFIFKKIGLVLFSNDLIGLWILNSISFSIILCILIKVFLKIHSFCLRRVIISSLGFSILIIFFYKSMLLYPLSDNIAIMLFLLSIFLSLKQPKINILNGIKYLFIGSGLYACYNTRPGYLISLIIFILVFIICNIKYKKNFVFSIVLIFLGACIVALPQMIINNIHIKIYSPLIIFSIGGSKNLNLLQLYLGLKCNVYKTIVAPIHQYPAIPGLISVNKTGEIIIAAENVTPDNITYFTIIKLIFKYPFEMIGIYFSHLTNLLFIFDDECYIKNMNKNLSFMFFINYIIIYLSVIFLAIFKTKRETIYKSKIEFLQKLKNVDEKYIYFACPMVYSVFLILGQVETRFFIYIHIIMYFVICFVIKYNDFYIIFKNHYIKVIISILCGVGIFSCILSYSLSSQPTEGMTFSINPYAKSIENELNMQTNQKLTPYIPKSELYKNGYCPSSFLFITKTFIEGNISFSVTFNKDITADNNMYIYINGKLVSVTNKIKKGTYDFHFNVQPNEINTVQINTSYYFVDAGNNKASFIFNNLRVK